MRDITGIAVEMRRRYHNRPPLFSVIFFGLLRVSPYTYLVLHEVLKRLLFVSFFHLQRNFLVEYRTYVCYFRGKITDEGTFNEHPLLLLSQGTTRHRPCDCRGSGGLATCYNKSEVDRCAVALVVV